MIQDVAYQSLLKSTRLEYHTRIVQVLEGQFTEAVETQPELLAHHCTEAGLSRKAVFYWRRAGERAIGRSALLEAIVHLTRGLELLRRMPETPERDQDELTMQIMLGVPLAATRGYGVPEVERAYARAQELCQRIGNTPQLFPSLYGMFRFYLLRAEYTTARELGEQLLGLIEQVQNPVFFAAAHRSMGSTLFYLGELTTARVHLEKVIHAKISLHHHVEAFHYDVVDPWVACRSYGAWTLWLLGYADEAKEMCQEGITMAQELNHPFSQALALSFAGWLAQFCGDVQRTRELAEEALAISNEQGFAIWMGWNMVMKGWAMTMSGQIQEGIAMIHEGLPIWRATGSELGRPYFLSLLAEAHIQEGKTEAGMESLTKALMLADKTGEHWWDPELYRLKGELLFQVDTRNEHKVEACFQQALDIAQRQQARSLELRVVKSLSRLWQQQGKSNAARQMLERVDVADNGPSKKPQREER